MGARGEATIVIGEREIKVLFTNRALADAEQALGRGIVEILRAFEQGGRIGDIVQLLRAGMEAARRDARAGGRQVTLQDAYDVLDEAGFATVIQAISEGVAAVLTYNAGQDAKNE